MDEFVFAAGDALGACAGVDRLRADNVPVVAVSGALTASPLAVREVQQVVQLPVFDAEQLTDPQTAVSLIAPPMQRKLRA